MQGRNQNGKVSGIREAEWRTERKKTIVSGSPDLGQFPEKHKGP